MLYWDRYMTNKFRNKRRKFAPCSFFLMGIILLMVPFIIFVLIFEELSAKFNPKVEDDEID